MRQLDRFLAPGLTDRPMLFEVFTDSRDESDAIRIMNNLNVSTKGVLKEAMKSVVGEKGKETIKKVMGEMKERESWFDFLRGVAVLMVIAIHTFAATSQKEEMVGDALIVSRQMLNCAVPRFWPIIWLFPCKKARRAVVCAILETSNPQDLYTYSNLVFTLLGPLCVAG